MKEKSLEYNISFHCYYENNLMRHSQTMKLSDIPTWINAYRFTHPEVKSICAKVWFDAE